MLFRAGFGTRIGKARVHNRTAKSIFAGNWERWDNLKLASFRFLWKRSTRLEAGPCERLGSYG